MSTIQRTFIPGSQWVYFKFYTGEKTADDILIKAIAPILKKLQKKQTLEKWFFIRYSDPNFHLRIRLLVCDTQYIGEVIQLFCQQLGRWNDDHLLWKVQLDTYNRELERYGKYLIEESESFFHADSNCILSIIKKLNGNENYRWMIALKLIDELLSDFGLNMEEKQKLMEILSKSYKVEFGFNDYNSKQFNTKFRENKSIVESVLNNALNETAFISLFQAIKKRTKELIPIVEQIKIKSKKDNNVNDLLKSYLHMMLIRLFRSKNRMHEMILYDFMFRYYTSEIAKKKYNKKEDQ
ncbi:MAG: thiopeptide-type bacteriocin biosynthesis protein [Dysgonamonadaceae bacterium]|jgi:thiopeptide-type bacteriocin biosynthesis protein|nr:thiopeptide-type bacteriocin biosynthesis protein [Dysgonamonadaceae bacterium]